MRINELKRLRKSKYEELTPGLSFTAFSLRELCNEIKSKWFPGLSKSVEVFFANQDALACIALNEGRDVSEIYLHSILSHTDTPKEVFEFIFKHELIHLVIPSREVEGKLKHHPPEFWEMEEEIAPEGTDAWHWIWNNFMLVLRRRPKLERTDVMRSWKHRYHGIGFTWEYCKAERMEFEVLQKAEGSTL